MLVIEYYKNIKKKIDARWLAVEWLLLHGKPYILFLFHQAEDQHLQNQLTLSHFHGKPIIFLAIDFNT